MEILIAATVTVFFIGAIIVFAGVYLDHKRTIVVGFGLVAVTLAACLGGALISLWQWALA